MTFQEYAEQQAASENRVRKENYLGQCSDWLLVARQDEALGLPVRPFPAVPRERIVEADEEGHPSIVDGPNPVVAPKFRLAPGPDGKYIITTGLKIGVPSLGGPRG